jgi:RHS repeat-associated protein
VRDAAGPTDAPPPGDAGPQDGRPRPDLPDTAPDGGLPRPDSAAHDSRDVAPDARADAPDEPDTRTDVRADVRADVPADVPAAPDGASPPDVAPETADTGAPPVAGVFEVRGFVRSAADGGPLPGAVVRPAGGPERALVDPTGAFSLWLSDDRPVVVVATADGHLAGYRKAVPAPGAARRVDDFFLLARDPRESLIRADAAEDQVATNADGTIRVRFPPGTVPHDLRVSITNVPEERALPAPLPASSQFTFAVHLEPSGTVFAGNVTLEALSPHPFPAEIPVPVGLFDPETASWHHHGTARVATVGGEPTLVYALAHFSAYDLNLPAASGEPCDDDDEQPDDTEDEDDCDGQGDSGASHVCLLSGEFEERVPLASVVLPDGVYRPALVYRSSRVVPNARIGRRLTAGRTTGVAYVRARLDVAGRRLERHVQPSAAPQALSFLVDLRDEDGEWLPTGSYDYTYRLSRFLLSTYYSARCFGCPGLQSTGVATSQPVEYARRHHGRVTVHNELGSPFGAGWTLSEWLAVAAEDTPGAEPGEELLLLSGRRRPERFRRDLVGARVVGTGVAGLSPDGTLAREATIERVTAIALDAQGRLLFADQSGSLLRRVEADGTLRTLAGCATPFAAESPLDGPALEVPLPPVNDILAASDGHVYLATTWGLRRIDLAATTVTALTSCDEDDRFSWGTRGLVRDGRCLTVLTRVAEAADGALLVADQHRLKRLVPGATPGEERVTVLSGRSPAYVLTAHDARYHGVHSGEGALAPDTQLWPVADVLTRPNGDVFVSSMGFGVYRLPTEGPVERVAGLGLRPDHVFDLRGDSFWVSLRQSSTADGAPGLDQPVSRAHALAPGPDGSVYLLDGRFTDVRCAGQSGRAVFHQTVVKRLDRDGRLRVVAGGAPAPDPCFLVGAADDVARRRAVDPDGRFASRQWLFSPDGEDVAWEDDGRAAPYGSAQGGVTPALTLRLAQSLPQPWALGAGYRHRDGHLAVAPDGTLYVSVAGVDNPNFGRTWRGTFSHMVVAFGAFDAEGQPDDEVYTAEGDGRVLRRHADGTYTLTDPEGAAAGFDAEGRIRWRRLPGGGTWTYGWDAAGRLATIDVPGGERLAFAYGAAGRLAAVSDGAGTVATLAHDAAGDLVSVTDATGRGVSFDYDPRHLLTGALRSGRGATTYRYDAHGRVTGLTDRHGHERTYLPYATQALLDDVPDGGPANPGTAPAPPAAVSVTGPAGTRSSTMTAAGGFGERTDAAGRRTVVEDRYLHGTRLVGGGRYATASDRDRPASLTAPAQDGGARLELTFDDRDRVAARVWRSGSERQITQTTYDGESRRPATLRHPLAATAGAEALEETYEWDAEGRLAARTSPDGERTTLAYDADGRLVGSTAADGVVTTWVRDADGFVVSRELDGVEVERLERDARRRVVRRTTPLEEHVVTWDDAGRLASVRDPAGGVTTLSYAADGSSLRVVDALGNETVFEQDAGGRPLATHWPWGGSDTFAYTAGVVEATAIEHPEGEREVFGYDDLGRVVRRELFAAGSAEPVDVASFGHDGAVRGVTSVGNGLVTIEITRGVLGAETRVDYRGAAAALGPLVNRAVTFTWSGGGLRLTRAATLPNYSPTWTFPAGASRPSGFQNGTAFACTIERTPVGLESRRLCESGAFVRTITRDARRRIVGIDYQDGGTAVGSVVLLRDEAGRVVEKTVTVGARTWTDRFGYDAHGQLALHDPGGDAPVVAYAWDAMGNPIGAAVTIGPGNQLLADAVFAYRHDGRGRIVERARLDGLGRDEYVWGVDDRLLVARRYEGAAPDEVLTSEVQLGYDGLGRRLSKRVGADTWRTFRALGRTLTLYRNTTQQFVFHQDPADGHLAYVWVAGTLHRVLTDEAGTPFALQRRSGTAYVAAGHRRFGPFGDLVEDTFTVALPLGVGGASFDAETGLYELGARLYDPAARRFLTPDPSGYRAGFNLYRYAANDPLSFADPRGLDKEPCCDDAARQRIEELEQQLADVRWSLKEGQKDLKTRLREFQKQIVDAARDIDADDGDGGGPVTLDELHRYGCGNKGYGDALELPPVPRTPIDKIEGLKDALDAAQAAFDRLQASYIALTAELAHLLYACSQ